MVELRMVHDKNLLSSQLQVRTRGFQVDASGALCGLTEWSEWALIPNVIDDDLLIWPEDIMR